MIPIRRFLLPGFALALLFGAGLWLAIRPSEEERVRRLVDAGRDAVAARSWTRLEPLVHPDYGDRRGWDKALLLRMAREAFQDCAEVSLEVRIVEMELLPGGERARVTVQYRVAGVMASGEPFLGLASEDGGPEEAVLGAALHRGRWRLMAVDRE